MPGSNDFARSWQGRGVDAIEVEHALANLTRQARPTTDQAPPHPIPRARVTNLVVRANQVGDLGSALDELSHLAHCHPLRAIVVRGGTGAPPIGLDASATIECVPKSGTPSAVCLERILLTLSDAASAHLSSVVAPLLIPDLPVVLWWLGGVPCPDDSLVEMSGNLIVDSDALGVPALPRLERLVGAIAGRVNVRDLAWTALEPIRDILAELFDPPEARPYQFGIDSLHLTFTAAAQPRLLLGWLASRLGWEVARSEVGTEDSAGRFHFTSVSGPVEALVTVTAGSGTTAEYRAVRVEITARHGGQAISFAIARQPDGNYRASRSAIPGLPPVSHPVALTRPSLVAVLSDLLAYPKEDEGYRGALSQAAHLAKAS